MSQTQTHTESLDERDPDHRSPKTKSRRPASEHRPNLYCRGNFRDSVDLADSLDALDTAFRQQRLKAWQPILTPKTVLPLFFIVGIIFAPIGGLLLYASSQVEEISLDYTDCLAQAPNGTTFEEMPSSLVSSSFKTPAASEACPASQAPQWSGNATKKDYRGHLVDTHICSLRFSIPNTLNPPVLLYYRLTNFYQNHRRYVKSLDSNQLKGTNRPSNSLGSCDPLQQDPVSKKIYYPCGLIANSKFNDSFGMPLQLNVHESNDPNRTYGMTTDGIAWSSDTEKLYGPTQYDSKQITPPPNWFLQYQDGYTSNDTVPNLQEDLSFQVWMRTAGLPDFSKLALRNDKDSMQCSSYQIDIVNNFPVTVYGGTKSLVISTRTVIGGKNPFLGIAYVAVGGICIVLGALFTVTHLIKPRKLGDHTYLSWNNDQPSTATATGISRHGNDVA